MGFHVVAKERKHLVSVKPRLVRIALCECCEVKEKKRKREKKVPPRFELGLQDSES